jgi:tetratricopeptide (TPR) repeat protein
VTQYKSVQPPNGKIQTLACAVLILAACPASPGPRPPRRRTPTPRPPAARRFVPPEAYRQFLLAEMARGNQDASTTLRHLVRALAEDPGSPYLRLRIAELLLARGKLGEALKMTRAAQRVAPNYAESYFLHGRLLAIHRPRAAKPVLERALRLDPDDERSYLWLARVRLRLGDPTGERAAYGRLLKRRPDNVEALFGLARAWARRGKRTRATRLLRRLLRAQPFAVRPRLVLARLLLLQGLKAQAVRALLDAMEASADDPIVAQELFRLYRVGNQTQQARDLVRLMEVHASARFLTFVASLYDALGQPKRALGAVTRALRQDSGFGPALALKARLLLRSRGPKVALEMLAGVKRGAKAFVAARVAQAEILESEGRATAASRLLRQSLLIKPRSAPLQETLALVCARRGQVSAAVRAANTAGRLRNRAPDDAEQRYFLALVLEEAGRFTRAARIARRLIRDDPDDSQALNLLGYGLAERSIALGEAVRLLERARRLDPLSPFILDSLGWARHRQGRHRLAVTLLRRAARADARLSEPWYHLGEAHAALGQRAKALRAYRQALARRPARHRRAVIAGKIARLQP